MQFDGNDPWIAWGEGVSADDCGDEGWLRDRGRGDLEVGSLGLDAAAPPGTIGDLDDSDE